MNKVCMTENRKMRKANELHKIYSPMRNFTQESSKNMNPQPPIASRVSNIPIGVSREVNAIEWECLRCGHKWVGRTKSEPKRCPKCKSPYWNKLRKQTPVMYNEESINSPKEVIGNFLGGLKNMVDENAQLRHENAQLKEINLNHLRDEKRWAEMIAEWQELVSRRD